jgi:hypothetical protein
MSINIVNDGGLGVVETLLSQYNALQLDFTNLVAKFNAHTHTLAESTYTEGMATSATTTTDTSVTSEQIVAFI